MTNKLKYFIGNWKMFGDFGSFKIVSKINQYSYKYQKSNKKKIILCVPNTLIHYFKKNLNQNLFHWEPKIVIIMMVTALLQDLLMLLC